MTAERYPLAAGRTIIVEQLHDRIHIYVDAAPPLTPFETHVDRRAADFRVELAPAGGCHRSLGGVAFICIPDGYAHEARQAYILTFVEELTAPFGRFRNRIRTHLGRRAA